ncbi:hypothetical protein V8G54_021600 [Vigna mungo]|uniref:Retrovirus-related Pol polyprotein from transposon TNT 1-94-like beta-barrel domain-containing protein n=1 Tax=Vigna mungo TaxID=3915 RepID=A0AAQ3RXI1_VIGMU
MDPLSPISPVFSMVVQQERQHLLSHGEKEPNAFINFGFTSSGKGRNGQVPLKGPTSNNTRNASNKKCVYCHRTGHTVETCYGKHGYPPGHPRYSGRPRFNQRDDTASANNAAQETNNNDHNPSIEGSSSNGSEFQLTKAQYQTLINLLQPQPSDTDGTSPVQPFRANITQVSSLTGPIHVSNSKLGISFVFCTTSFTQPHVHHCLSNTHTIPVTNSQNKTPWIIDSGATDHIASSLDSFFNYSKIKLVQINLPNGTVVFAHILGFVQLSPNFIIHNVLFVPNFNFNLLSISKLILSKKYSVTFSSVHCYI